MGINKFVNRLRREIESLNKLKNQLEKRIQMHEDGKLNICSSKGKPHYYKYVKGKKKEYLKLERMNEIKAMAQKEYDVKIIERLEKRIMCANCLLDEYESGLSDVYSQLSSYRKELVVPIIGDINQSISLWYAEHPGEQNPYVREATYQTERGEQVRSKSEKIIADLLYSMDIPYVYEPKLFLEDGTVFYPDFLLYCKSDRKTIAYEHFGMMGDEEYSKGALRKIRTYHCNGYWYGENLIYSMESTLSPLDARHIRRMLEKYLLE